MKRTVKHVFPTIEELEIHGLRLDISSIREAGYSRTFAREYLIDRYVNLDTYMTVDTFEGILNEGYKTKTQSTAR